MSRGVSGTAVALASAGGLLLYTGISGVSPVDALRSLVGSGTLAPAASTAQGRIPNATTGGAPFPGAPAAGGGSGAGARIAADAAQYANRVRYLWGGADPSGWDCSGFATWVLAHDLGYQNLPDEHHTVCMQFLSWSGAQTIPTAEPGALVVWPTHMGIALDATTMISALNPSRGTVITTFRDGGPIPWSNPTFRRVL